MAISANTIWEVRPSNGVDTYGGGFVSGASGTDWTQQNSAKYSLTNGVANGTTTVTTVSATTDMVGNIAYIAGGTGSITAAWYQITAASAGVSITVDRSTGLTAGTGVTINIGGALKTLTQLNTNFVPGNFAWVKAESTISTGSTITFNFTASGSNQLSTIAGYTTTRGDSGQVEVLATANCQPIINLNSRGVTLANFDIEGNTSGQSAGIYVTQSACRIVNITVNKAGTNQSGFRLDSTYCHVINCKVTNNASGGNSFEATSNTGGTSVFIDCQAYGNSSVGFNLSGAEGGTLIRCIAGNNTGIGFSGMAGQACLSFINCTAYVNTSDGFKLQTNNWGSPSCLNCISYGNGGYGFNYSTGTIIEPMPKWNYNAYGSNTTANLNGISAGSHDVTLTADPTTNGAANDFTLNSTTGGGAACKGAGFQL